MEELKLRDIKPLMEVDDYSIYFVWGATLVAIILLIVLAYYLYRFFKHQKEVNLRKIYIDRLKNVNLQEAKSAAYEITYCLHQIDIEEKNIAMAHNLIERLEKYKYKKDVHPLDEDVKGYYHLMMEVLASE